MIRALTALLLFLLASGAAQVRAQKRVLVVQSYRPGSSWSSGVQEGIERTLGERDDVVLFTEWLDSKRRPLAQHAAELRASISAKYRGSEPDAILTVDDHAFRFVLESERGFLARLPIVFCGLNGPAPAVPERERRFTGIRERTAPLQTVRMMRELMPQLRRVCVVGGETLTAEREVEQVREELGSAVDGVRVEYWRGRTFEEVERQAEALEPGRDAVLLTVLNQDAAGQYASYEVAASRVASAAAVPVFGLWDFYVGTGVTGGFVVSAEAQGEAAANMIREVLQGASPADIPLLAGGGWRCILDDRALRRFVIDRSRIPERAQLRFPAFTLFERYRREATTAVVLLLLQALLVFFFFLRSRRHRDSALRAHGDLRRISADVHQRLPIGLLIVEMDSFLVRSANEAALRLLGLTSENCVGAPAPSALGLGTPDRARLRDAKVELCELRAGTGPLRLVERSVTRSEIGRRDVLVVSLVDVTERETHRADLEAERALFLQGPTVVFRWDLQEGLQVSYCSPNVAEVFGWSAADFAEGRIRFDDFVHPDDVGRAFDEAQACLQRGTRYWQQSYRVRTKSGSVRVVDDYSMIHYDESGRPKQLVGYLQDCTERFEYESRAREAAQRYEMVIEGTEIATWDWQVQSGEVVFNEAWARFVGRTLDELAPISIQTWMDLAHPEDLKLSGELLEEHFAGRSALYECECRMKHRDGHWIWVLDRGRVVEWDEDGKPVRMIGTHAEITQRKEMQQRIEATVGELESVNSALEGQIARASLLAAKAEEANQAKSEFLANMSHEIRTPMTGILGYSELLEAWLDGKDDLTAEEARDAVLIIHRNGDYLLALINDILDLSKIEAGKLQMESAEFDLRELVDGVAELLRSRAREKGVELEFPVPEVESLFVGDRTRLRQVLVNLVGNAIKFSHQGGRTRLSTRIEGGDEDCRIVFEIEDDGIGMTAEESGRIFDPFEQADTSTTRRFGGTGLGLAISRRLAQLHGGSLRLLRSAPEQGSCFELTVTCAAGGELRGGVQEKRLRRSHHELRARVLLAEDGPDNVRLLRRILEKAGAEVFVVSNGREAVDRALAAEREGQPFDVLLMDMQMPVLDGYGAARELRSRDFGRPIIAITAHAMEGDRRLCIEAGCSGYATKPLDKAALFAELDAVLGVGEPGGLGGAGVGG